MPRIRKKTRQGYWRLIGEVMACSQIPRARWTSEWMNLARDRNKWAKLTRKWKRGVVEKATTEEWEKKHEPGGPAEKKTSAAQKRLEVVMGITFEVGMG